MGFLDKLISTIKDVYDSTAGENISYTSPQTSVNYNDNSNIGDTPIEYFEEILKSEFSQYELKRNISTTELGASQEFRKYDFVLYKDNEPILVLMVTPHNRDNNRTFLGAKEYCINSGIKFLNFYSHFENERNYVINRIKDNL